MTERSGRAVGQVPVAEIALDELRALGWGVDDLGIEVHIPFREFASLEDAKAAAERDLPRGTTVSWHDGTLGGGFIVGYEGIAPPLGEPVPAFVLRPDLSELYVETREQLDDALRERHASAEPVAWLRWDGFRKGWTEPDGESVEERRHAVHYDHEGEFLRTWQDAVRAGIAAATLHLRA